MKPEIHIDGFTHKGKQHLHNEDYFCYGGDNYEEFYMSLCDGCSSAKNSDMGARILSHFSLYSTYLIKNEGYETYIDELMNKSMEVTKLMDLPSESLFATLLLAYSDEGKVNIIIFGDGSIIFKLKESSTICIITIKMVGGEYPYYPLYYVDEGKRKKWGAVNGLSKEVHIQTLGPKLNTITYNVSKEEPFAQEFDEDKLEFLLLASDGINSFHQMGGNHHKKNDSEFFKQMLNFKNFKGEFIQRRFKRFVNDCAEERILNLDDLTVVGASFLNLDQETT